jgi:hypothetical protein
VLRAGARKASDFRKGGIVQQERALEMRMNSRLTRATAGAAHIPAPTREFTAW